MHVSELDEKRINNVDDVFKVGERIPVKVLALKDRAFPAALAKAFDEHDINKPGGSIMYASSLRSYCTGVTTAAIASQTRCVMNENNISVVHKQSASSDIASR